MRRESDSSIEEGCRKGLVGGNHVGVGFVGAQKDCTLVGEEAHVLLVKVGDGEERVLRERLRLRCMVVVRLCSSVMV